MAFGPRPTSADKNLRIDWYLKDSATRAVPEHLQDSKPQRGRSPAPRRPPEAADTPDQSLRRDERPRHSSMATESRNQDEGGFRSFRKRSRSRSPPRTQQPSQHAQSVTVGLSSFHAPLQAERERSRERKGRNARGRDDYAAEDVPHGSPPPLEQWRGTQVRRDKTLDYTPSNYQDPAYTFDNAGRSKTVGQRPSRHSQPDTKQRYSSYDNVQEMVVKNAELLQQEQRKRGSELSALQQQVDSSHSTLSRLQQDREKADREMLRLQQEMVVKNAGLLQQELRKRGSEFSALQQQVDRSHSTQSRLQRDREKADREMSRLQQELNNKDSQLSSLQQEVERKEEELSHLQQDLQTKQLKLSNLEVQHRNDEEMKRKVQLSLSHFAGIKENLRAREERCAELEEELQRQTKEHLEKESSLRQKLLGKSKAFQDQEEAIEKLKGRIIQLEKQVEDTENEARVLLAQKELENSRIQRNLDEAKRALEDNIAENNILRGELEQEMATKDADLSRLQQELRNRNMEFSALQQQVDSRDSTQTRLQQERKMLRLQQELNNNNSVLSSLQQEVERKDEELSRVQQALQTRDSELKNRMVSLQQEMATKDAELSRLQQQVDRSHSTQSRLQQDKEKAEREMWRLQQELNNKDSQLSSLQQEVERKEEELSRLQQALQTRDLELSRLNTHASPAVPTPEEKTASTSVQSENVPRNETSEDRPHNNRGMRKRVVEQALSHAVSQGNRPPASPEQDDQVQSLLLANESLQKKIQGLESEKAELQKRCSDAYQRLSSMASERMRQHNACVEDLSDPVPHSVVVTEWQALMNGKYWALFEVVQRHVRDEKQIAGLLYTVFQRISGLVQTEQDQFEQLPWEQLSDGGENEEARLQSQTAFTKYLTREEFRALLKACAADNPQFRYLPSEELRRVFSASSKKFLKKKQLPAQFIQEFHGEMRRWDMRGVPVEACHKFADEVLRLCYLMALQSPPMALVFDSPEDNQMNALLYEPDGDRNKPKPWVVSYVILPPLLHHKNGPVLSKGIVELK